MFCPLLYIVDPQDKPKMLKKSSNLLGMLAADPELNNFYYRKYRPDYLWYGEALSEQFSTFLESYIDGSSLKADFRSEERRFESTLVK